MSTDDPQTPPVEETLAWEAEQRPRVGTIAIAGGALTVIGSILFAATFGGGPTEKDGFIGITQSLNDHLNGRTPEGSSLFARQVDYYADKAVVLSISTVLLALSVLALMYLMLFLYRSTYARTPAVGRMPYYLSMAGLVLYPLGHLLRELSLWIAASGYADDPDRTAEHARDVLSDAVTVSIGALIELVGTFGVTLGVVLVCLHAMRAGLLTRFFGVLGMIVGGIAFLSALGQPLDQPGIIRAFFMIGVGLMLAGRIRVPPAWDTGRAEPWPSRQQMIEQRDAAAGRAPRTATEPASAPAAEPGAERVPARTRKKRKDRR